MDVSAVLVTRGDVDIDPIVASLPFDDIIVWDNSKRTHDWQCYGRFAAIEEARHDLIYTQDDDCLCPAQALADAYDGTMLVNVPADEKPLTAWGAVFHRHTVEDAFERYLSVHPFEPFFWRTCDVIHTSLTPWRRHHLGHMDFEWASAPNRMYHQPNHYNVRLVAEERCRTLP